MPRLSDAQLAALSGLLHDVDKLVARLLAARGWRGEEAAADVLNDAVRAGELTPSEVNEAKQLLDSLLGAKAPDRGDSYAHGHARERLFQLLGLEPPEHIREALRHAVAIADWESTLEKLDAGLRTGQLKLEPHTSPLLSPFAVLSALGLATHDVVHISVDSDSVKARTARVKCKLTSSSSCQREISDKLRALPSSGARGLLEELGAAPVWHPVRPIRWRSRISEYYARLLPEAQRAVDYVGVNASLVAGLCRLLHAIETAKRRRLGFDPVTATTAIYRRALLFVPSTVRGSQQSIALPEISLYAHSRVVAAFATALQESRRVCGRLCYRLLVLDIMNIQRYVTRHRSVSAAVRALRGRSLVVELAQRAAANYALARLGLLWSSVYTYEGGLVSIIVPCCRSLDSVAKEIEDAFQQEFQGVLGIAAAYTREISFKPGKEHSRYRFDPSDPESFTRALSDALRELAARKANVEARLLGVHQPQDLASDPFTGENVPKHYYVSIDEIPDIRYWGDIAGDEGSRLVEEAGGVSLDTHRALVAGTAAPNMKAIIEVYLGACSTEEAGEVFRSIAGRLFGSPAKRYTSEPRAIQGMRYRLALVDFPSLLAGYILVSIDHAYEETQQAPWPVITTVLQALAGALRRGGCRARIVVTRVNVTEDFLPPPHYLDSVFAALEGLDVTVSFDWVALNTRYPVNQTEDDTVTFRGLDETAKSGLVALVKMDGDNMGSVMFYMSSSPSRLATASEILSLTFGLLGYRLLETTSKAREKVYIVYMGGDDAVFFGDLPATLEFALSLEELYARMLPGMTISAGAAVEDVKLPLYLAYMEAARKIEEAKNEPIVLVEDEQGNDLIASQGSIAIGQVARTVTLCTNAGPLELGTLKWRGYASLEKAIRIAEKLGESSTRAARALVELADTLATLSRSTGCSLSTPEVAKTLISYAYTREKLRQLSGQDIVPNLLRDASGIKPDYPPRTLVDILRERLRLYLALLLARNTLNTAYQLHRVAGATQE